MKHYAPDSNKVKKPFFSIKVTVKVTRSLTLVSIERVCMPNMKCLSLTVQKLKRMLKLTTDKQTDRQDKTNMTPIYMYLCGGIKNLKCKFG